MSEEVRKIKFSINIIYAKMALKYTMCTSPNITMSFSISNEITIRIR